MASDFNTRFAQLCEAFELTTAGEWRSAMNGSPEGFRLSLKDRATLVLLRLLQPQVAKNSEFVVLAHNFFPAIKEEMARLRNKGCECACHSFPEHAKLQDIAEANRFHIDKLRDAQATIESQASELTEARARIEKQSELITKLRDEIQGMKAAYQC